MEKEALKVPKIRKQVNLWVHPEGLIVGSLFVREQSIHHSGSEEPIEALNEENPFIVLHRENPAHLRFYNRNAIVRVEYEDKNATVNPQQQIIACQLNMMDGSLLSGEIRETLAPDRARLFDYLNQENGRFIKLHVDDSQICLVNISYIINVTTETADS